jgi:hypothetical protein
MNQGPIGVKVKTSRGEQLLRWNWEEKATMCISYVRYGG